MKLKIISPEALSNYLYRDEILIIDLREKSDYEREHIPGAIWADWEKIEKEIEQILYKTGRNIEWIILYCDHGNISLLISRDLGRAGYNVISLNGGYSRWKSL